MSAAPAIRALLVAHGQPADPAAQEGPMREIAARTEALSGGLEVRGCTLAAKGSLEAALAGAARVLVYPFFMAGGWFVSRELPRRLAAAGARDPLIAGPLGAEPGLAALARRRIGAARRVLLAGHGSARSDASARSCEALAARLRRELPGVTLLTGYAEQAPFLEDSARALGGGLCLPFFALAGGHVGNDIPGALAAAEFQGETAPPIGHDPGAPALIAARLRALVPAAAA